MHRQFYSTWPGCWQTSWHLLLGIQFLIGFGEGYTHGMSSDHRPPTSMATAAMHKVKGFAAAIRSFVRCREASLTATLALSQSSSSAFNPFIVSRGLRRVTAQSPGNTEH